VFRVETLFNREMFLTHIQNMFQVQVFWVVTPCNVVVGYQLFRDPCCL